MRNNTSLTGCERSFGENDVIVTKTDLKGQITYANRVFLGISELTLDDAIGAPHSLIRHPDMPRCVFKLLWERIENGKEIFAYVLNRAFSGDHYWVFAHATPSYGGNGQLSGYHSNRRAPKKVRHRGGDQAALCRVAGDRAEIRRPQAGHEHGLCGADAETD